MQGTGSPSSQQPLQESPTEDPKVAIFHPETNAKNVVVVVAFYGVSCMGKSELVTYVRDRARLDKVVVADVSKDSVSRPMLDAYQKLHPEIPFQDIYMTIYSEVMRTFSDEVFRSLSNLKPGKNILIIDDAWANTDILKRLKESTVAPGYEKKLICVYPKVSEESLFGDLPFSLQFILNMCYRVVTRKAHETMVYNDLKKVQIVLSFIKLYSGVKSIPTKFSTEADFIEFCPIEFHQESHLYNVATSTKPSTNKDVTATPLTIPDSIQRVYDQVQTCFLKLGTPFETPFIQGKEEVEQLVELIRELESSRGECKADDNRPENSRESNDNGFINFGRKTEWEKWYNRVLCHMI